jgi:cell wall-associated NlpC family hydrolase
MAIRPLVPWLSFIVALRSQFPEWAHTPYELWGERAIRGVGADCGGLVHAVFKDAGYDYPWKGPSLEYNKKYNFPASVEKGGVNEKNFRKLNNTERPILGDIVVWDGKHMAIYAGKENKNDIIFTSTNHGNKEAKTMRLDWMDNSIDPPTPVTYFRWRF